MFTRQTKNIVFLLFITFLFSIDPFVYALTKEEIKKLPHISAYQAYVLFQQGKIIIFDVHPGPDKKRASVLGAYYLDKHKIDKLKLKLPQKQLIGVY